MLRQDTRIDSCFFDVGITQNVVLEGCDGLDTVLITHPRAAVRHQDFTHVIGDV